MVQSSTLPMFPREITEHFGTLELTIANLAEDRSSCRATA